MEESILLIKIVINKNDEIVEQTVQFDAINKVHAKGMLATSVNYMGEIRAMYDSEYGEKK